MAKREMMRVTRVTRVTSVKVTNNGGINDRVSQRTPISWSKWITLVTQVVGSERFGVRGMPIPRGSGLELYKECCNQMVVTQNR